MYKVPSVGGSLHVFETNYQHTKNKYKEETSVFLNDTKQQDKQDMYLVSIAMAMATELRALNC